MDYKRHTLDVTRPKYLCYEVAQSKFQCFKDGYRHSNEKFSNRNKKRIKFQVRECSRNIFSHEKGHCNIVTDLSNYVDQLFRNSFKNLKLIYNKKIVFKENNISLKSDLLYDIRIIMVVIDTVITFNENSTD